VVSHNIDSTQWTGRRCVNLSKNGCFWPNGVGGLVEERGSASNGYGRAEEQCALGVDDEAGEITETLKHKRYDSTQGDDDIVTIDMSYDKIKEKLSDPDTPFDFEHMTGDIYEIGKATHNYKEEGRFKITELTKVHGEDEALEAKNNGQCGILNTTHQKLEFAIRDTMATFTNRAYSGKYHCKEIYDKMVEDKKLDGL